MHAVDLSYLSFYKTSIFNFSCVYGYITCLFQNNKKGFLPPFPCVCLISCTSVNLELHLSRIIYTLHAINNLQVFICLNIVHILEIFSKHILARVVVDKHAQNTIVFQVYYA